MVCCGYGSDAKRLADAREGDFSWNRIRASTRELHHGDRARDCDGLQHGDQPCTCPAQPPDPPRERAVIEEIDYETVPFDGREEQDGDDELYPEFTEDMDTGQP